MVDERDDRDGLAARLFGEIQAEGLRAAGALVERLVQLVDGPHAMPADPPENEHSADPQMDAVLPWLELWRDVLERTSETLERLRGSSGDDVHLGADRSLVPTGPLAVTVDVGGSGQAEMWLHNGTGDDQGELVPHCAPLSDGYGNVLEGEVDISPPKIDRLHARSSRSFVISVAAEPTAAPGLYRGIVQVRGAESVWMPIEVIVTRSS